MGESIFHRNLEAYSVLKERNGDLLAEYLKPMRAVFVRLARTAHLPPAEIDLFVESFPSVVLEKLKSGAFKVRNPSKVASMFDSWLCKVCRNEAASYRKLLAAWQRQDKLRAAPALASPSPASKLLEQELKRRVEHYVSRLAPVDQDIMHYKYKMGLAWPQIARLTGRSLATVFERHQRALNQLADALGPAASTEERSGRNAS